MTARPQDAPSDARSVRAILRPRARDPILVCGLAFLLALVSLYIFPIVSPARLSAWSEGPIFVPLLFWVVAATFARSRHAPELQEQRFWRWIACGFACWLAALLLSLTPAWGEGSLELRLIYDGLFVAFYLQLFLATTKAPHAPRAAAQRDASAGLVALGTVIFGVGMTAYFDLIPYLLDRSDFGSRAPAFYLFLALDFALIARAATQVRATKDRSWRWPYALVLLATALLGLGDLLDLLDRLRLHTYASGTATDFLWYGVLIAVAVAASLRESAAPPLPSSGPPGVLFSSPLLTFAFIVPLVHFVYSGAGLLGARSQHPREAVALATMAGVLLVAWWQQLRLERSHLALERELDQERLRVRNAERLEAVATMAGGVAHDFNNQLAIVLGYAELLEREAAVRPELLEPVREISVAASRAARLTKDLLAVGGRQALARRPMNLNEVVGALENQLRALTGSAIRLELALAPEPATVMADRGEIERAILSLAANSTEAMPNGGRLCVSVALSEPLESASAPRLVTLEVLDEGRGMPAEVLAHALEPFFTTKPFGQSGGLGLAAVHGAVTQLGGTLTIASEPGKGTRVTIRLPYAGESRANPL